MAASEAAKEAVWLSRLYKEIAHVNDVPILFVDNASAIKLAKNPEFHKKTKHIDVRSHYVREKVVHGQIIIEHIYSKDQVADICTKPIPRVSFVYLRSLIGML